MSNGNITMNVQYRQFAWSGGNSTGYLYGAFAKYGDGVHIGYNFYNDNTNNVIPNAGGPTSRMTFGFGTIACYTGGLNTEPTILGYYQDSGGSVGIGTNVPTVKLDVLGVVRARTGYFTSNTISNDSTSVFSVTRPGIYQLMATNTIGNWQFNSIGIFRSGVNLNWTGLGSTGSLPAYGATGGGTPTITITLSHLGYQCSMTAVSVL